ncbi:hypothetical protein MJO28_006004 [Puccinia striiformis f. sp. tritici]|uniref:Uncharacterized protein n=4 Tax=Puccinia striiformis TaxID=27350 RepID=A0A2S4WI69_9BASI|nr:hypothetical protein MJO28_006004 [Puccinia striiformis f. sp. tritici]POW05083.1 hypothetical protein PSTT_09927 [Puccinia striiformis]POW11336.1 hypothetical protein PSTT_05372 [Puccinia striiformis]POW21452.1 hypothetical protein PSHT_02375 [Puccinia striiformis]
MAQMCSWPAGWPGPRWMLVDVLLHRVKSIWLSARPSYNNHTTAQHHSTQPQHSIAKKNSHDETKEAFALFDKKGTGTISCESLGDLLRALGQNPTQAEVAELAASAPRDIDFATFSAILNRPGGFSPAGTAEDFIRGFRVFDKEGNGYIGAGELRYVLTSLGEKLSDEEVDELMKGVQIGSDGNIDYEKFVRSILQQ